MKNLGGGFLKGKTINDKAKKSIKGFPIQIYYLNLRENGQKQSLDCHSLLLHTNYKSIELF